MQIDSLPLVLTVREAAEVLRLGRDAAYSAVATGQIPSIRLGRRIVVPRAALVRLLNGEPLPELQTLQRSPTQPVAGRIKALPARKKA